MITDKFGRLPPGFITFFHDRLTSQNILKLLCGSTRYRDGRLGCDNELDFENPDRVTCVVPY